MYFLLMLSKASLNAGVNAWPQDITADSIHPMTANHLTPPGPEARSCKRTDYTMHL